MVTPFARRFGLAKVTCAMALGTVSKFANDVIKPRVREMDENEKMDPVIIKGLFEQGVRLCVGWELYSETDSGSIPQAHGH